jgi:hypothetical protein
MKTAYSIEDMRRMLKERAETTDRNLADDIDFGFDCDSRNMAELLVDIHDIVMKARFMSQHLSEADLWRSIVIEVQGALGVTAHDKPTT